MSHEKNGDDLWYDYETEPPAPSPTLKQRLRTAGFLVVLAASGGALLALLFEMVR